MTPQKVGWANNNLKTYIRRKYVFHSNQVITSILKQNLDKSVKSALDDAKSNATDENNTSAAESAIPLDDDNLKSHSDSSTKGGKGNVWQICNMIDLKTLGI